MKRGECPAHSIFTRSRGECPALVRSLGSWLPQTDSIWGLHLRTAMVGATETGSFLPCLLERFVVHFRSSVSLGTVECICLLSPPWLLYPSLQTSLLDPASLKRTPFAHLCTYGGILSLFSVSTKDYPLTRKLGHFLLEPER